MIYKIVLILLLAPGFVSAADTASNISDCFKLASEHHNIPAELLIAVAQVESGLHPFALNQGGVTIVRQEKSEAAKILDSIAAERTTFDVGIMQVNRWWFEKYSEPYQNGLDVCFNVDFGAKILAMTIRDYGFTWKAVGAYHSPTSWRQNLYSQRIFKRLEKILQQRRTMSIQELLGKSFSLETAV